MIKRLSGTLILDSGLVVNSYNFLTHLPVGSLKHSLRRLQEFEIDDIILLNTTHSENPAEDFREILSEFDSWHISTPLSYGGGIKNVAHAVEIVKTGAERIVITSKLLLRSKVFSEICSVLGDQAVILHLPLVFDSNNVSVRNDSVTALETITKLIPKNWGGEILLTFAANDGEKMPNWEQIDLALAQSHGLQKLILAGGFSSASDISRGLNQNQVSAISVGNFLHRTELSIIKLKTAIDGKFSLRRMK
jgi:cyclase